MSNSYYSVAGRLVGQRVGGTRIDLLSEAVGSVTATASQAGSLVNTYRFRPYGSLLMKTGGGADPRFGWGGTLGYRSGSDRTYCDTYIRARHYGSDQASWTSVDELWPSESAYVYALQNPVNDVDPSGKFIVRRVDGKCGSPIAFQITFASDDAKSVASGLGNNPQLLSGPQATEYCKNRFPGHTGRTLVVNGTLFHTTSGKPHGRVRDCQRRETGGNDVNEIPKGIPFTFGTGVVYPRKLHGSKRQCLLHNIPGWETAVDRSILHITAAGTTLYIFSRLDGEGMCSCFPFTYFETVLHLDGGSSVQIWIDAQPIYRSGRDNVNNFLWTRERFGGGGIHP